MMRIEYLSVLPQVFSSYLDASIMGRAAARGVFGWRAHDLRDWTHDHHRTVDDAPFGGGQGMLMKPEPIFEAVRAIQAMGERPAHVVFFTPAGRTFDQRVAAELALRDRLLFVCGRYEGMDERVFELADECLSVGDYVLTGGELCALAVTDAVVRLLPGALGSDLGSVDESFQTGLLEYAQYTRPANFEGRCVPEVLLSGDHAAVDRWRRESALERTARLRPDLLDAADVTDEERAWALSRRDEYFRQQDKE